MADTTPPANDDKISIRTNDGTAFELDRKVACMSTFFLDMLADTTVDQPIQLSHIVTTKAFSRIEEWCEHHQNDPAAPATQTPTEMSSWDQRFMAMGTIDLFELIEAVNYLNIEPLLHIVAKTLANMLKGKNVEEMRLLLGVYNDFTPEQGELLRQENAWAADR